MHCKSLWIKASAKCRNANLNKGCKLLRGMGINNKKNGSTAYPCIFTTMAIPSSVENNSPITERNTHTHTQFKYT